MDLKNVFAELKQTVLNKAETIEYELYQKLIMDRKTRELSVKFLKMVEKYVANTNLSTQKNARLLLIYPIILFHRSYMFNVDIDLNDVKNIVEYQLVSRTRDLHEKMMCLNKNIDVKTLREFNEIFMSYANAFQAWKEKDKTTILDNLIQNYWELEVVARQDFTHLDDDGEEMRNLMKQQQDKILSYIKDIAGDEGIEQFRKYIPIVYTDELLYNVIDTLEIAYWDVLREDLCVSDETDRLYNILVELKAMMLEMVGSNDDYINRIQNTFDVDFIVNMLKNKVLGTTELNNFVTTLVNFIKEMDAEANDDENDEFLKKYDNFVLNCDKIEANEYKRIVECMIYALEYILPKCRDILDLKNNAIELLTGLRDVNYEEFEEDDDDNDEDIEL